MLGSEERNSQMWSLSSKKDIYRNLSKNPGQLLITFNLTLLDQSLPSLAS
jgi:hypothetical protein